MTNEEKQALIGLCRIEIKRWKAASEANPNMRYMVELMEVALASLEAEPEYNTSDAGDVHLDVSKSAFDRCHPDYRWVSYTAPPAPEDWQQRAEAAEERASNLNDGWLNAITERDEARAKLEKLAELNDEVAHERNRRSKFETDCKVLQEKLAELVPDAKPKPEHGTRVSAFTHWHDGWNACRAAILRNIEQEK